MLSRVRCNELVDLHFVLSYLYYYGCLSIDQWTFFAKKKSLCNFLLCFAYHHILSTPLAIYYSGVLTLSVVLVWCGAFEYVMAWLVSLSRRKIKASHLSCHNVSGKHVLPR
jgi:hypothetical protein